jgi:7-carboxy-7-deazaguanine synthase
MHQYYVDEIFHSIQGEGYHSGKSAIFIRMHGCNEHCEFCDTKQGPIKDPTSLGAIMKKVNDLNPLGDSIVVITGGEPTMQNLLPLVNALRRDEFYVCIETNGFDIAQFPRYKGWVHYWFHSYSDPNWITLSPKQHVFEVTMIDELKLLYGGNCTIDNANHAIKSVVRYLQPVYRNGILIDLPDIIRFIKNNPEWRLSLQIHKMIGIQ